MMKPMIIVNYAPFHVITDPDLCEGCYFMILQSDKLLGCQEQPLLERYA